MDRLLTRGRREQLDAALSAPAGRRAPEAVARELALAERLRQVGAATAPAPSEEFRTALRTRLLAVAAVQGVGATAAPAPATTLSAAPATARSWRSRATAVGAGTLATVVAASGVAVAGSRSLPGDPFYGVKRTAEAVQLRAAGDGQAEGTRHLQFAATRMQEVRDLLLGRDAPSGAAPRADLGSGDLVAVRAAMADMDADTRDGSRLLTGAFRETRASTPLEELRRFAARQRAGLAEVMPALGGTALAQAQGSLALLDGVQAEADELLLLVDCTAACDPARSAPVGGSGGSSADASCDCGSPAPAPPSSAAVPPPAPAPAPGQQPPRAPSSPGAPGAPAPSPQPPAGSAPPPGSSAPQPPPPSQPGPSVPVPEVPLPGSLRSGEPLPSVDVPGVVEGALPELDAG